MKKFDFVIGNPPYQDNTIGDNDTYAPPVYHKFLDEAFKISDKVLMVHPARFLFNAGSTPKSWNERMLKDAHFKVLKYESDSTKFFDNKVIKGGAAISYRDKTNNFGSIGIFTPYNELNTILNKIVNKMIESIENISVSSYAYHFNESLYKDFPNAKGRLSKGHDYDLKSNAFEKLPMVFENDSSGNIRVLGRENNSRTYKFIKRKYLNDVINLDSYKVFLPGGIGTGQFGEKIPEPIKGLPGDAATETFMSIGNFDNEVEMINLCKYLKTKFARTLLGVLKRTQANTPGKWHYVPLQDFTSDSDIDWSKSIPEIDQQLYAKYGLTDKEIDFIETNVKEMV